MALIDVLLTQQAAAAQTVQSGWSDPLFAAFVIAAAVQLLLIGWVVVNDSDAGRNEGDG